MAAFAHILAQVGIISAIEDHVQFARARFGTYDTLDMDSRVINAKRKTILLPELRRLTQFLILPLESKLAERHFFTLASKKASFLMMRLPAVTWQIFERRVLACKLPPLHGSLEEKHVAPQKQRTGIRRRT